MENSQITLPTEQLILNNFVPFEESVLLENLGFNLPCFAYYNKDKNIAVNEFILQMAIKGVYVPFEQKNSIHFIGNFAPLYQQAFYWFRKNYGLSFECKTPDGGFGKWVPEIHKINGIGNYLNYDGFLTHEEAKIEGLRGLIKMVSAEDTIFRKENTYNFNAAKIIFKKLTNKERANIFKDYCKYCGCDDPYCRCSDGD